MTTLNKETEIQNYFLGKDVDKVFKNKNTTTNYQIRKQVNQISDIPGATPKKHHEVRWNSDKLETLSNVYTKSVYDNKSRLKNMKYNHASASNLITNATTLATYEPIKRTTGIKTSRYSNLGESNEFKGEHQARQM